MNEPIFIKAKLENTVELIVNVGASVAVKKTVDETRELLKEQAIEIENYKAQVAAQLELIAKRGTELEEELEKLVK